MITSVLSALAVVAGALLLMQALGENKQLFKNPSDIVRLDFVQPDNQIRVGGLVVRGSVEKPDGLRTDFTIINFENADPDIPPLNVHYEGVLPDLFRDGQGVVLTGKMTANRVFVASNILAKHDENYMPKMPNS